jgi:hypothetical protein
MNRDDVIDVLTAVAAADRRTVGEADVTVWAAIIGDLPKDMALQAVITHFRECPGVWLEPGFIVAEVKRRRRERWERESELERAMREAAIDAKVADVVREISAGKGIPDDEISPPRDNPLRVGCPFCDASVGERCTAPSSKPGVRVPLRARAHPSRIDAAKGDRHVEPA